MTPAAQRIVPAALVAALATPVQGFAAPPATASVVLFNTVCARCHEMECSQRLSFSSNTPADHARGHIESYAGPSDAATVKELFDLLEYTKTRCDYYAPAVPIPADGVWSATALAQLATRDRTAWFVPLGRLAAGAKVLSLEVDGKQAVEIEVLGRKGVAAEERTRPGDQSARVAFVVDLPDTGYFLRLRSRAPIVFRRAVLEQAAP